MIQVQRPETSEGIREDQRDPDTPVPTEDCVSKRRIHERRLDHQRFAYRKFSTSIRSLPDSSDCA